MHPALKETIGYHALRGSGVTLFLLLWELAPRLGWIDPYFVPPFSRVLPEIGRLWQEGALQLHLVVSIWRAACGLVLAALIALPVGLLLGERFAALSEALDPVLRVLSQVNPFTLMPVFVLFFGIGETAKVAVVAWVSLWPILFYTITGVRGVDPVQVKSAASLGVTQTELLLKVLLPASLPTIAVGVRIGATITFYILVAAEMLGSSAGLGFLVHNSAMNYQIPRIYAGATFIVLLGFLLNRTLQLLERNLFDWQLAAAYRPHGGGYQRSLWQPGRLTVAAGSAFLLLFLILGGVEVQKIDREAAQPASESGGHSHHLGTPVDNGGF